VGSLLGSPFTYGDLPYPHTEPSCQRGQLNTSRMMLRWGQVGVKTSSERWRVDYKVTVTRVLVRRGERIAND
jgi:hypothetical protein